jgi:hypothetical protein
VTFANFLLLLAVFADFSQNDLNLSGSFRRFEFSWLALKKRYTKYGIVFDRTAIYGGLEIRDLTKNFSEWTVTN